MRHYKQLSLFSDQETMQTKPGSESDPGKKHTRRNKPACGSDMRTNAACGVRPNKATQKGCNEPVCKKKRTNFLDILVRNDTNGVRNSIF